VAKALKMAELLNVPVLGLVENYSYIECPDCKKQIKVFGESHIDEVAKEHNVAVLGKMPIDPILASNVDKGLIELFNEKYLDNCANVIEGLL